MEKPWVGTGLFPDHSLPNSLFRTVPWKEIEKSISTPILFSNAEFSKENYFSSEPATIRNTNLTHDPSALYLCRPLHHYYVNQLSIKSALKPTEDQLTGEQPIYNVKMSIVRLTNYI